MELIGRVVDAYLQETDGANAARLRFLEGLWDIQFRIESAGQPFDAPDSTTARESLASGQSLFFAAAPRIEVAEYVDAVSRIALYASEMAGLPEQQATALGAIDFTAVINDDLLATAATDLEAFVDAVSAGVCSEIEGTPSRATVAFVLVSALVPFMTGPSAQSLEVLGEFDATLWSSGTCPVCGSAASMGRMGESTTLKGAERTLWCGLCHAEWRYERIRCVRCGTRAPDKLRYTYVEGDSAHRVHLCDECHGHTRFVFVNDLTKPLSMIVEEAVSLPLEAVAAELGYTAEEEGATAS